MTRRTIGAFCVVALVAACLRYTSGDPSKDPRAFSPLGPVGTVYLTNGARYYGELLAVDDSSYVLLSNGRVIKIPIGNDVSASFSVLPYTIRGYPPARHLEQLRLESRFPQGIPPAAMTAILARQRQEAPDVVVPERAFDAARAGTARYSDVNVAIADGFKKVGVEFPAMGEHWVNVSRVLDNRFALASPTMLIYVNVGGTRRLAGLGYTALLGPGEHPPLGVAPEHAWHEHNGSVAEESFPLHHGVNATRSGAGDLRLSILHAWVWTPNPAGLFVTDNWSLPLVRIGVDNLVIDSLALRGASLALDVDGYYELMLRTGLRLANDASETDAIKRAVDTYRDLAARALRERPFRDRLDPQTIQRLSTLWDAFWDRLARDLPGRANRLREIRAQLSS